MFLALVKKRLKYFVVLGKGLFLSFTFFSIFLSSPFVLAADIDWNGGSGNFNDTANWSSGTVPTAGDTIFIDNGNPTASTVLVNVNRTIDGFTVDDTDAMRINNNISLTLNGPAASVINGTLLLNSSGATTTLFLNSDLALNGTGFFYLSDFNSNWVYSASATVYRLTIGDTLTVSGSGNLGWANRNQFTNNGLIDAVSSTGKTLTIEVTDGADGFINNDTLRSSSGGTLLLTSGTYNNNAVGTIHAGNNSEVRLSGATIQGGTLSSDGSGVIRVIANSTFDGTANAVNMNADFIVDNGVQSFVRGTINLNGDYLLNSTAAATYMQPTADTTINGTGNLTLSDNINNWIYSSGGTYRVTFGPNMTVQGAGNLGWSNLLYITNNGLIDANSATGKTLKIETPNVADGMINNGTVRSSGGGVLNIESAFVDNTNGAIEAGAGSTTQVTNASTITGGSVAVIGNGILELSSGTIHGGTLTNSSTGLIRTTGGTSTLGGTVTNPAGGEIRIQNGHQLWLEGSGAYTNDGLISLNSTSAATYIRLVGDVALNGTGEIVLSNNTNNWIYSSSGASRLTLGPDTTLRGSGHLGFSNQLTVTNNGVIEADSSVGLIVDTSSAANAVINSGTMRASNGAILTLTDSNINNANGVIEAQNGSEVQLSASTISGGTLQTSGTGIIRTVADSTFDGSTNAVNLDGTFILNNSIRTFSKGTVNLDGSYLINSSGGHTYWQPTADTTINGTGTITMSNSLNNWIYSNGGTFRLTLGSGITLEGAGNLGWSNLIYVTNNGLIDANASAGFVIDPNDTAGSFINNGTLQASNGVTLTPSTGGYVNNGIIKATGGGILNWSHNVGGTGGWTADGGTINLTNGVDVTTTGDIAIANGGQLNLVLHANNATITGNDLNLTGANSSLSVNSGITLSGDFLFNITDETDMTWGANSVLTMTGGAGLTTDAADLPFWKKLEVGGTDLGNDPYPGTVDANPAGFTNNFSLTKLVIAPDAHVKLVDLFDNGNRGGGSEALYVDTLEFQESGAGVGDFGNLWINGLNLYYNNLVLPGGGVLGDILLENILNTLSANNTGNGNHVDLGGGVLVAFDQVTADGNTGYSAVTDPNVLQSFLADELVGYLIDETFVDITTSANFDNAGGNGFLVKLPYDQADFNADIGALGFTENQLRLFHKNGATIEDITATADILARFGIVGGPVDTANNFIYGFTNSFSPFGVGVNPEPGTLLMLLLSLIGFSYRRFSSRK